MTDIIDEVMVESPGGMTPTSPSPANGAQTPLKLKGRKRLLKSLERISSSPSLHRFSRSNHYNGSGGGSMSCISLSSPQVSNHSANSSYSSSSSAGFSTAPTSLASTPSGSAVFGSPRARCGTGVTDLQLPSAALPLKSVPVPVEMRPGSRGHNLSNSLLATEVAEDYFSRGVTSAPQAVQTSPRRENFNFWGDMPSELRIEILGHLTPKELVGCSAVSRSWHNMCFDGQLWTGLDASDFYRAIPSGSLSDLITRSGPFMRDLNLRGCVQIQLGSKSEELAKACLNLQNLTLEGCRIEKSPLRALLSKNTRLVHVNLTGLSAVSNSICSVLAKNCPALEVLNVSWCSNMDARGARKIIDSCERLRDLRVGEISGFNNKEVMQRLFETNRLERLVMNGCTALTDEALKVLVEGANAENDPLTGRPRVPPRKLRHLDLGRCHRLTSDGLEALADNVPELEGLQLGGCTDLSDDALTRLLPTVPKLTHLDLEEIPPLTNKTLQNLAQAPCASRLRHLTISYCEKTGDTGMLPVIKACQQLEKLEMDNTRISDLVLVEAAMMLQDRARRSTYQCIPTVGLHIVAYDCPNVTWTGVREVLSRNAEIKRPSTITTINKDDPEAAASTLMTPATFPTSVIQIKCFYGWQMTVDEHTKRVLRGELAAATRLEQKWASYMMATEEAGAGGAGSRRRRRRAREAAMLHADEEEVGQNAGGATLGAGRRRRARSGGCAIM
ncbi:MAG: threonine synthase [Chaenotheca gracillima]|nr:MAG: threonine synthase [Chaenotheca gracillima]